MLDYGCGSGDFLQTVGDRIDEGIGIELDSRLVEQAKLSNRFSHIRYVQADAKSSLPFEDGRFDVIVVFGVLEHVGPERPYIQEFYRLLRPRGILVVEVPSNGPFRMFDVGNVKYNFPRLHRWFYYHVARQGKYYEKTFGPDADMFGQFTKEARQHKHYSTNELVQTLEPYFKLERHAHYGLFFELIQFVEVLACKPLGRSRAKLFSYLMEQDCKLVPPIGRANIVGVFRRIEHVAELGR